MKLAKFPFGHAALAALGTVLLAGAAAAQPAAQPPSQPAMQNKEAAPGVAPPRAMLPGGRMMPMLPNYRTNFAFIPANTPASSNKVGIFVAKHLENSTTLYYCAMPADGTGNSVCKQVKGFPSE
ncbi:MAG TPA: hypothetical protein VHX61_17345 [Rhizomicrobium sp.]|jgi:hypothetical protein|nr:hypothetical protein [Rhizomicrobium sp.]